MHNGNFGKLNERLESANDRIIGKFKELDEVNDKVDKRLNELVENIDKQSTMCISRWANCSNPKTSRQCVPLSHALMAVL